MKSYKTLLFLITIILIVLIAFNNLKAGEELLQKDLSGLDMKKVERGRYISMTSGCNDCHTSGYLLSEGKVPEEMWLTGDSFGWRGPWGTTYASNLRIIVNMMTQEQFVDYAKTLRRRPPMPWYSLNIMTTEDLESIYQFIRYLGSAGDPAPAFVPPDQEPNTPYALFPSPPES